MAPTGQRSRSFLKVATRREIHAHHESFRTPLSSLVRRRGAHLLCVHSTQQVGSKYVKTEKISASQGGSLTVAASDSPELAGAKLVIPPGALAADQEITLELGSAPITQGGDKAAGQVALWGPSGTRFAMPVEMTLPYTPCQRVRPPTASSCRASKTTAPASWSTARWSPSTPRAGCSASRWWASPAFSPAPTPPACRTTTAAWARPASTACARRPAAARPTAAPASAPRTASVRWARCAPTACASRARRPRARVSAAASTSARWARPASTVCARSASPTRVLRAAAPTRPARWARAA
ncbi:MAG: hypothetical protein IPJ65_23880 [Archangiaceae bacterium]|nr:hypothetical protein [Archangiaceae bacterium]